MPLLVGANTNAAAVMIGEKASDLIPVSYTHLDVYKRQGQKCAFCHIGPSTGKFMLARRMPKDQAELPSRTDLQPDYVKAVVRNGLVNMPTFTRVELTDAELNQIAAVSYTHLDVYKRQA